LSDPERIKVTGRYNLEDIDLIVETIAKHDIVYGSPWDNFRLASLELPSWFDHRLDPYTEEYAQQQHKLWTVITRKERPYAPELDEQEAPLAGVDAVRRPGYETARRSGSQPIRSLRRG
jgi:hypothetical protein